MQRARPTTNPEPRPRHPETAAARIQVSEPDNLIRSTRPESSSQFVRGKTSRSGDESIRKGAAPGSETGHEAQYQ